MHVFFYNKVMFWILFVSSLSAIFIMGIRYKHFSRNNIFSIIDMFVLYGIYKYIEFIPSLHEKLGMALKTSASIIMGSEEYLSCFERISKLTVHETVDIASYLYRLEPSAWEKWEQVIPSMLYEHLFQVFEQILGAGWLGYVHLSVWDNDCPTILFIVLGLFCIGMFVTVNKNHSLEKTIPKVVIIFFFFSSNVGTFVATFTMVMMETIIHMFLNLNDDNEVIKMEKCQDA